MNNNFNILSNYTIYYSGYISNMFNFLNTIATEKELDKLYKSFITNDVNNLEILRLLLEKYEYSKNYKGYDVIKNHMNSMYSEHNNKFKDLIIDELKNIREIMKDPNNCNYKENIDMWVYPLTYL